jgi:hypothetical protein
MVSNEIGSWAKQISQIILSFTIFLHIMTQFQSINYIITHNFKNINQITFYFVEKGPGRG